MEDGRLNQPAEPAPHGGAFVSAAPPCPPIVPAGAGGTEFTTTSDGSYPLEHAPYATSRVSQATITAPLLAQSPLYQDPAPPYSADPLNGDSYAGRLQPAIGWDGGSYALNTQTDAGTPTDDPALALPGIRDGSYHFTKRLAGIGDQGIANGILRDHGNYLDLDQAPYIDDTHPLGR